jgi:hypothetical protein
MSEETEKKTMRADIIRFGAVALAGLAVLAMWRPWERPAAPAENALTEFGCYGAAVNAAHYANNTFIQIAQEARPRAFIRFAPKSMICDQAAQTADVWVEREFAEPQPTAIETATSIERITYTRERYLYKVNCATKQLGVAEQVIVNAAGEPFRRIDKRVNGEVEMGPSGLGSLWPHLEGPVCRVGLTKPA